MLAKETKDEGSGRGPIYPMLTEHETPRERTVVYLGWKNYVLKPNLWSCEVVITETKTGHTYP